MNKKEAYSWFHFIQILNPTGFNYFDKSEQPIWTMQDAYESQSIYGITACHCCIRTLNTEGGIDI